MPESPKRTSISEILLVSRQKLINDGVLPGDRIFIISRERHQIPDLHAVSALFLRPRGFSSDQDIADAGGRYTTKFTRVIDVIVRVRRQLDKAGSDIQLLTDDEDGAYFYLEERAVNALQIEYLYDGAGNSLTCEAPRIVDGYTPEWEMMRPGWMPANFGVEVKYLFNADPLES